MTDAAPSKLSSKKKGKNPKALIKNSLFTNSYVLAKEKFIIC